MSFSSQPPNLPPLTPEEQAKKAAEEQRKKSEEAAKRSEEAKQRNLREAFANEHAKRHFAKSYWRQLDKEGGESLVREQQAEMRDGLSIGGLSGLSKMKDGVHRLESADPKYQGRDIVIEVSNGGKSVQLVPAVLRHQFTLQSSYEKAFKLHNGAAISALGVQGFDTIKFDFSPEETNTKHRERELEMMIELAREKGMAIEFGQNVRNWLSQHAVKLGSGSGVTIHESGADKLEWFYAQERESRLNIQDTRSVVFDKNAKELERIPKMEDPAQYVSDVMSKGGMNPPHTPDYSLSQIETEMNVIAKHTDKVENTLDAVTKTVESYHSTLQDPNVNLDKIEKNVKEADVRARKSMEAAVATQIDLKQKLNEMGKELAKVEQALASNPTPENKEKLKKVREAEQALEARLNKIPQVQVDNKNKMDSLPQRVAEMRQQQLNRGLRPN